MPEKMTLRPGLFEPCIMSKYGKLRDMSISWHPFRVDSAVQIAPRPLITANRAADKQGIGDRLRTAAFAEMQAEAAFLWAATNLADASSELRDAWRALAVQERKHMNWLMTRMQELEIDIVDRPVSDALWHSLTTCQSARDFCRYMADAEERGRRAGERFCEKLKPIDPITAEIFGTIAFEERSHIELALKFS